MPTSIGVLRLLHLSGDVFVRHVGLAAVAAWFAVACSARNASDAEDSGTPQWPVFVPLSGCDYSYSAMVAIGGATPLPLSMDTGSPWMAVAETGCTTCAAAGIAAFYTPGASAHNLQETWTATYGDGQTWTGKKYQDAVQVAGTQFTPAVEIDITAITTESKFFYPIQCADGSTANPSGIMGLGLRPSSDPRATSFLDQLIAAGMPDVFAFALCPSGGSLWLGGFDPSYTTGPVQYVPLLLGTPLSPYYEVYVGGLSVDGVALALSPSTYGEALVDTGGRNFLLPTAAYQAMTKALDGSAAFQHLFGDAAIWLSSSGMCIASSLSADALDTMLPQVGLTLGSSPQITLMLGATHSYVGLDYDQGGQQYLCPAAFDSKTTSAWDIGDIVLRANLTIFDRAGKRMGFAPHKVCR